MKKEDVELTSLCVCRCPKSSHMHFDRQTEQWESSWCRNVMCGCKAFEKEEFR